MLACRGRPGPRRSSPVSRLDRALSASTCGGSPWKTLTEVRNQPLQHMRRWRVGSTSVMCWELSSTVNDSTTRDRVIAQRQRRRQVGARTPCCPHIAIRVMDCRQMIPDSSTNTGPLPGPRRCGRHLRERRVVRPLRAPGLAHSRLLLDHHSSSLAGDDWMAAEIQHDQLQRCPSPHQTAGARQAGRR